VRRAGIIGEYIECAHKRSWWKGRNNRPLCLNRVLEMLYRKSPEHAGSSVGRGFAGPSHDFRMATRRGFMQQMRGLALCYEMSHRRIGSVSKLRARLGPEKCLKRRFSACFPRVFFSPSPKNGRMDPVAGLSWVCLQPRLWPCL